MGRNYRVLGFVFLLVGVVLSPPSYFILSSAALTAVGLSMIILGFTSIALSNTYPPISPDASGIMLEIGMENTAALLEELGLRNKAIYFPSSGGGYPKALVPVKEGKIQKVEGEISERLVVRFGTEPEDAAIVIIAPGSMAVKMLETPPGPSAGEIESALSYILIGILDLATSVTVALLENRAIVEINDPRLYWENIWFYRSLGSPLASIAATILCEGLAKPVRIKEESYESGKARIELEVLD